MVTYTVTYSGASVVGLSASDITLNKSGTANCSVAVTGSGSVRTVTLSTCSGVGTAGISIAAGSASNSSGSAPASGPSAVFGIAPAAWHYLGTPRFGGGWINSSYNFAMAVDSSGYPTVVYASGAGYYSSSSSRLRAGVMRWNGSQWVALGDPGIYNTPNLAIAIDPSGNPYIAYLSAGYTITVIHWDGKSWNAIGSPINTGTQPLMTSLAVSSSGTPYIAFSVISASPVSVMYWNGTSWVEPGNTGGLSNVMGAPSLALDSSGNPYVAGQTGQAAYWNGSAWVSLGAFASSPQGPVSLALDPTTGSPWVAFPDPANSNKATVSRWNGSAWVNVGSAGISTATANFVSLAIDAGGTPYLTYQDAANDGRPAVLKWNGTSWSALGSSGLSSDWLTIGTSGTSFCLGPSGTPYLLVNDLFTGQASILAYDADFSASSLGWTAIGPQSSAPVTSQWSPFSGSSGDQSIQYYADENCGTTSEAPIDLSSASASTYTLSSAAFQFLSYRIQNSIPSIGPRWSSCSSAMQFKPAWSYVGARINGSAPPDNSIAVATDLSGNPYVSFTDSSTSTYDLYVMHWNGTSWSALGGSPVGSGFYPHLAVDPAGNLYIAYADYSNGNRATVQRWNGTSWSVIGTAGFSAGGVDSVAIAVDSSGNPSVLYDDWSNSGKATVQHWNGTNWSVLGTAAFTSDRITFPSIAIDSSGNPYIAFQMRYNASVMHWDGTSWNYIGSAGFAESRNNNPIALDSSGNPYIVFSDMANSSKATVMHWNGSAWTTVGGAPVSDGATDKLSIAVDGSGNVYAAFRDWSAGALATVLQWNGSTWSPAGQADFSLGVPSVLAFALSPSGKPFLAYTDSILQTGFTVRRLDQ